MSVMLRRIKHLNNYLKTGVGSNYLYNFSISLIYTNIMLYKLQRWEYIFANNHNFINYNHTF